MGRCVCLLACASAFMALVGGYSSSDEDEEAAEAKKAINAASSASALGQHKTEQNADEPSSDGETDEENQIVFKSRRTSAAGLAPGESAPGPGRGITTGVVPDPRSVSAGVRSF